MTVSTRLVRAALAFVVFGAVASALPGTTRALADSGTCPQTPIVFRSRAEVFQYFRILARDPRNSRGVPNRVVNNFTVFAFSRARSR